MMHFSLAILALAPIQASTPFPSNVPVEEQDKVSKASAGSDEGSDKSKQAEIVVTGERADSEIDPANLQPKVFVGSRIPRRSMQNNPNIASATSLGGLTPTSGMDPFAGDTTLRWKSCQIEGYSLGDHACALGKAQKAIDAGEWESAQALAAGLASRQDLSIDGQYLAQRMLYSVAVATSDAAGQRTSLEGMVATGVMPAAEELAALRTLASKAMRRGDPQDAILKYKEIAILDGNDHRSRINLGALLQQVGTVDEGRVHLRDAIEIMKRNGEVVPVSLELAAR